MTLLTVTGVNAGYGAGDVLKDISFEVPPGEIVVVLGANGAGKTTLMRVLSGTLRSKGEIRLDDRRISRLGPDGVVRAGIALVPQGRGTFADLTVEENLRIGAFLRRDGGLRAEMERWYETFPRLAERSRQKAGLLSGGEQQMLALARAMMSRPRLLLCDEPSLGLSPKLTKEVFSSLVSINTELGMSVLLVEQNAALALGIAHRGHLMEAGRLSGAVRARELMDDPAIRVAYLGG